MDSRTRRVLLLLRDPSRLREVVQARLLAVAARLLPGHRTNPSGNNSSQR